MNAPSGGAGAPNETNGRKGSLENIHGLTVPRPSQPLRERPGAHGAASPARVCCKLDREQGRGRIENGARRADS